GGFGTHFPRLRRVVSSHYAFSATGRAVFVDGGGQDIGDDGGRLEADAPTEVPRTRACLDGREAAVDAPLLGLEAAVVAVAWRGESGDNGRRSEDGRRETQRQLVVVFLDLHHRVIYEHVALLLLPHRGRGRTAGRTTRDTRNRRRQHLVPIAFVIVRARSKRGRVHRGLGGAVRVLVPEPHATSTPRGLYRARTRREGEHAVGLAVGGGRGGGLGGRHGGFRREEREEGECGPGGGARWAGGAGRKGARESEGDDGKAAGREAIGRRAKTAERRTVVEGSRIDGVDPLMSSTDVEDAILAAPSASDCRGGFYGFRIPKTRSTLAIVKLGRAKEPRKRQAQWARQCRGERHRWLPYYWEVPFYKKFEKIIHCHFKAAGAWVVPHRCRFCTVRHQEKFGLKACGGVRGLVRVVEYYLGRLNWPVISKFQKETGKEIVDTADVLKPRGCIQRRGFGKWCCCGAPTCDGRLPSALELAGRWGGHLAAARTHYLLNSF
ncbi:hypothetical protein B0H11DRAFT_2367977, partial [Mycena galericulata]